MNPARAAREDGPGVSRLLTQWRAEEGQLKEKVEHARRENVLSPEAIEVLDPLDELLNCLSEADQEKLAFAIRQTVKRINLRRERRSKGRHRITMSDGVIELRDELGADVKRKDPQPGAPEGLDRHRLRWFAFRACSERQSKAGQAPLGGIHMLIAVSYTHLRAHET